MLTVQQTRHLDKGTTMTASNLNHWKNDRSKMTTAVHGSAPGVKHNVNVNKFDYKVLRSSTCVIWK